MLDAIGQPKSQQTSVSGQQVDGNGNQATGQNTPKNGEVNGNKKDEFKPQENAPWLRTLIEEHNSKYGPDPARSNQIAQTKHFAGSPRIAKYVYGLYEKYIKEKTISKENLLTKIRDLKQFQELFNNPGIADEYFHAYLNEGQKIPLAELLKKARELNEQSFYEGIGLLINGNNKGFELLARQIKVQTRFKEISSELAEGDKEKFKEIYDLQRKAVEIETKKIASLYSDKKHPELLERLSEQKTKLDEINANQLNHVEEKRFSLHMSDKKVLEIMKSPDSKEKNYELLSALEDAALKEIALLEAQKNSLNCNETVSQINEKIKEKKELQLQRTKEGALLFERGTRTERYKKDYEAYRKYVFENFEDNTRIYDAAINLHRLAREQKPPLYAVYNSDSNKPSIYTSLGAHYVLCEVAKGYYEVEKDLIEGKKDPQHVLSKALGLQALLSSVGDPENIKEEDLKNLGKLKRLFKESLAYTPDNKTFIAKPRKELTALVNRSMQKVPQIKDTAATAHEVLEDLKPLFDLLQKTQRYLELKEKVDKNTGFLRPTNFLWEKEMEELRNLEKEGLFTERGLNAEKLQGLKDLYTSEKFQKKLAYLQENLPKLLNTLKPALLIGDNSKLASTLSNQERQIKELIKHIENLKATFSKDGQLVKALDELKTMNPDGFKSWLKVNSVILGTAVGSTILVMSVFGAPEGVAGFLLLGGVMTGGGYVGQEIYSQVSGNKAYENQLIHEVLTGSLSNETAGQFLKDWATSTVFMALCGVCGRLAGRSLNTLAKGDSSFAGSARSILNLKETFSRLTGENIKSGVLSATREFGQELGEEAAEEAHPTLGFLASTWNSMDGTNVNTRLASSYGITFNRATSSYDIKDFQPDGKVSVVECLQNEGFVASQNDGRQITLTRGDTKITLDVRQEKKTPPINLPQDITTSQSFQRAFDERLLDVYPDGNLTQNALTTLEKDPEGKIKAKIKLSRNTYEALNNPNHPDHAKAKEIFLEELKHANKHFVYKESMTKDEYIAERIKIELADKYAAAINSGTSKEEALKIFREQKLDNVDVYIKLFEEDFEACKNGKLQQRNYSLLGEIFQWAGNVFSSEKQTRQELWGTIPQDVLYQSHNSERMPHPFKPDVLTFVSVNPFASAGDAVKTLMPLSILSRIAEARKKGLTIQKYPDEPTASGTNQVYNPFTNTISIGEAPAVFPHEVGHKIFLQDLFRLEDIARKIDTFTFWNGHNGDPKTLPTLADSNNPVLVQEYKRLVGAESCQVILKVEPKENTSNNTLNEHFANNIERLVYGAPFIISEKSNATTQDILNFYIKTGIITEEEANDYIALATRLNGNKPLIPIKQNATGHIDSEHIEPAYAEKRIINKSQKLRRALTLEEEIAVRLQENDVNVVKSWLSQDREKVIELLRFQRVLTPELENRIRIPVEIQNTTRYKKVMEKGNVEFKVDENFAPGFAMTTKKVTKDGKESITIQVSKDTAENSKLNPDDPRYKEAARTLYEELIHAGRGEKVIDPLVDNRTMSLPEYLARRSFEELTAESASESRFGGDKKGEVLKELNRLIKEGKYDEALTLAKKSGINDADILLFEEDYNQNIKPDRDGVVQRSYAVDTKIQASSKEEMAEEVAREITAKLDDYFLELRIDAIDGKDGFSDGLIERTSQQPDKYHSRIKQVVLQLMPDDEAGQNQFIGAIQNHLDPALGVTFGRNFSRLKRIVSCKEKGVNFDNEIIMKLITEPNNAKLNEILFRMSNTLNKYQTRPPQQILEELNAYLKFETLDPSHEPFTKFASDHCLKIFGDESYKRRLQIVEFLKARKSEPDFSVKCNFRNRNVNETERFLLQLGELRSKGVEGVERLFDNAYAQKDQTHTLIGGYYTEANIAFCLSESHNCSVLSVSVRNLPDSQCRFIGDEITDNDSMPREIDILAEIDGKLNFIEVKTDVHALHYKNMHDAISKGVKPQTIALMEVVNKYGKHIANLYRIKEYQFVVALEKLPSEDILEELPLEHELKKKFYEVSDMVCERTNSILQIINKEGKNVTKSF